MKEQDINFDIKNIHSVELNLLDEQVEMDLCQVFRHIFLRIYIFFQASLEQLI